MKHHRVWFTVFILLMFVQVVAGLAQNEAGWCEVEAPEPVDSRNLLTVAEDAPQIAELVPLPPNTAYSLWHQGEVKISADGTHAVTSVRDQDTWKEELVGISLEEQRVYFRLTVEDIEALKPPQDDMDYEGVLLWPVVWLGESNRLVFQTSYICHNCGEGLFPPDDLHLIDEQGNLTTLLDGEEAVEFDPAPDGEHVLFGDVTNLSLLRIEDGYRWDNIVPNYHADAPPYGLPRLYATWKRADPVLVLSHTDTYHERSVPIELWRVFTDGRDAEFVSSFVGVFSDNIAFSPDGRYIAYAKLRDAIHGEYDLMIQELATGQEWVIVVNNPQQVSGWSWAEYPEIPTLRYFDADFNFHYVARCEAG
jgi:hypothetical protein